MTFNRALIVAYTAGVRRAANDYRAHPTAACPRNGCDQLAVGRLCRNHENDTNEARDRARKARAA